MRRRETTALAPCFALAFLGAFSAAVATESPERAIAVCREAGDQSARIACLEAALRGEVPDSRLAPGAPADDDPSGSADGSESSIEPGEEDPVDIGRTQVEARNLTREQRLAQLESAQDLRVAGYSEAPYRRIVVHLENGQVWRQITGDNQRFRVSLERNQTVDISESSLGGYQLRFNQLRRTIRVERIE